MNDIIGCVDVEVEELVSHSALKRPSNYENRTKHRRDVTAYEFAIIKHTSGAIVPEIAWWLHHHADISRIEDVPQKYIYCWIHSILYSSSIILPEILPNYKSNARLCALSETIVRLIRNNDNQDNETTDNTFDDANCMRVEKSPRTRTNSGSARKGRENATTNESANIIYVPNSSCATFKWGPWIDAMALLKGF